MQKNTKLKVHSSFHRTAKENVYLRDTEKNKIKEFLRSKESFLHICGKPGTGKTLTVKSVLSNKKHLFLNAYSDTKEIRNLIKTKGHNLFVIDEFDIFDQKYKKESQKIKETIVKRKNKLTTISNYLRENTNTLFFNAYSSNEIEEIILLKIKNEIKENVFDEVKIKLLAKKCYNGDLRNAFESVINEINGIKNEINKSEDDIHKEIIKEIIFKSKRKNKYEMYEEYIKKCNKKKLAAYERSDFINLCDLCE